MAEELVFRIFDVCGTDPDDLQLLVHVEEAGGEDDWETYRTAIVRLHHGVLTQDVLWDDWAQSFWRSPKGVLYVAGGRDIYTKALDQWAKFSPGRKPALAHIWGLNDDEIYCSGFKALFLRRSGDDWLPFNEGLSGDLNRIGGTAPDDLYVLGKKGVIFHYDGAKWMQMESPTGHNLVSVLPVSRTEAYFCGYKGTFLRLADGAWQDFSLQSEIEEQDPPHLYRMIVYQEKFLVSSGSRKGIFQFDGGVLHPFAPKSSAGAMQVIGGRLFAVDGDLLHVYDGTSWTTTKLDFSQAISL